MFAFILCVIAFLVNVGLHKSLDKEDDQKDKRSEVRKHGYAGDDSSAELDM